MPAGSLGSSGKKPDGGVRHTSAVGVEQLQQEHRSLFAAPTVDRRHRPRHMPQQTRMKQRHAASSADASSSRPPGSPPAKQMQLIDHEEQTDQGHSRRQNHSITSVSSPLRPSEIRHHTHLATASAALLDSMPLQTHKATDGQILARPVSPSVDARYRRYRERMDHHQRMNRSIDSRPHMKEIFDVPRGSSKLWPWFTYRPHVPVSDDVCSTASATGTEQSDLSISQGWGDRDEPQLDASSLLDATTRQKLQQLRKEELAVSAAIDAHDAATEAKRQELLAEFDQRKGEEKADLMTELERVRAMMGRLASRAASRASPAVAEHPHRAALRRMREEAAADPELLYDLSGCLMGTPAVERYGL